MNPSPSAQNPISHPLKKANPSSHFTPSRPSSVLPQFGLLENVVPICNEALKITSEHVTAHYRRAKAFKVMEHHRRVVEDLEVVLRDGPGDEEAERELLECQHCQKFVCDTHWFYFSDSKLLALDK